MAILIQDFDPVRMAAVAQAFSEDIDSDPWVMFHGTSGFNSESIEREGFSSMPDMVSHEQLRRVATIYETMKWVGESGGGYQVLKPFSLDHDLQDQRSPLFFAETSLRALLYATRDFSGGEKLRALRIALRDLDSYLGQHDVRERHDEQMNGTFRSLARLNAHPSALAAAAPTKVDLDWLRHELASLLDVRRLADSAYHRHDHGVVYALRLAPGDTEGLVWNRSMGIEAANPIPASKIISKIVVPPNYEMNLFAEKNKQFLRRANRGLLAALAASGS